MELPEFEDNWLDVVQKASRGLGVTTSPLDVFAMDENHPPGEEVLRNLAGQLHLNAEALVQMACDPPSAGVTLPSGVHQIPSVWGGMVVNTWLVETGDGGAVIFDTGTDAGKILKILEGGNLKPEAIFITHSHGDHIACLGELLDKVWTGIPVYTGVDEPVSQAEGFEAGRKWKIGGLAIGTRLTWGHCRGGITYTVEGLPAAGGTGLAIVGDAIFASSMGGGKIDYRAALETNRREIFSLPDDTIICPGHGYPTTVGHERKWNPFFQFS